MPAPSKLSLELAARELLGPTSTSVEVDDISAVAPISTGKVSGPGGAGTGPDLSEPIELTAEEIDAFLEERLAGR